MKKLDVFILKTFLGPFLISLFIADIVLVLQMLWVVVDQLVGKGLGMEHMLRFVLYTSMLKLSMAVPVSILIASIMTYGKLSETSESVAMSSTGLSFARISTAVGVLSILLGVCVFFLRNNLEPSMNKKLSALRYDIIRSKPTFSLEEDVFYTDLSDFVILVGDKSSDDHHIDNVIIYGQTDEAQDNLMIANNGVMETKGDGRYLRFVLDDGWYYQNETEEQFVQFSFNKYVKDFPLWKFQTETEDSLFSHTAISQTMSELNTTIRNASTNVAIEYRNFTNQYIRSFPLLRRVIGDSASPYYQNMYVRGRASSLQEAKARVGSDDAWIFQQLQVRMRTIHDQFIAILGVLTYYEKQHRAALVEWNEKLILALVCFSFFLIGAPIGSIIKRGGLGLPFVFAISFFVMFTFSDLFGQRFSREIGGTDPYFGVWMPSSIFFIIGVVLFLRIMGIRLFRR